MRGTQAASLCDSTESPAIIGAVGCGSNRGIGSRLNTASRLIVQSRCNQQSPGLSKLAGGARYKRPRGALVAANALIICSGIIPAYAGNTGFPSEGNPRR